jgi:two-component system nitrogen regulation sensor histidine kinase NtrY
MTSKFYNYLSKLKLQIQKYQFKKKLHFVLTISAGILLIVTCLIIRKNAGKSSITPDFIFTLLLTDLILFLSLLVLLVKKVTRLWATKKKELQGSRLHINIISTFSTVSIIPTIIVVLFSTLFFHYGIESWFNTKVNIAITESLAVAESYLEEHKQNIRNDVIAIRENIDSDFFTLISQPDAFAEKILTEANQRSLIEVMIFQEHRILAQTAFSFSLAFERLPLEELNKADKEEIVVTLSEKQDKMRALVKLHSFPDTYLLIGRLIDDKVLGHINNTKFAVNEYNKLKQSAANLQLEFLALFIIISLLIVLTAIWFGINFIGKIMKPISKLIEATGKIKSGNLAIRVEEGPENDEIGVLARAFNLMTEQIEYQTNKIIEANQQIDLRRIFTETVLSGVSAGVIALNTDKTINLANKSALLLLETEMANLINYHLSEVIPEFIELFEKVVKKPDSQAVEEVHLRRKTKKLIFLARIIAEHQNNEIQGYIITFDDITPLAFAQRSAAWADVARRIAHEIKNPLTPISLAAQRLKRKFASEISDPENFSKYIDTIIKHVADISKIVEEFVNFARMPSPAFTENDICSIIKDTIFSREILENKILYQTMLPTEKILITCDASQIQQALLNIYKNAEESIQEINTQGKIITTVIKTSQEISISIQDNGQGIQEELFSNLTQPYITNKTMGTGLGLAIVKKIFDDHNAKITFQASEEGGLIVKISFPVNL